MKAESMEDYLLRLKQKAKDIDKKLKGTLSFMLITEPYTDAEGKTYPKTFIYRDRR